MSNASVPVYFEVCSFPSPFALRCDCGKVISSGQVYISITAGEHMFFLGTEKGVLGSCCGHEHFFLALFDDHDVALEVAERYKESALRAHTFGIDLAKVVPMACFGKYASDAVCH